MVPRSTSQASSSRRRRQVRAHFQEVAASLHDDESIGVAHPAFELVLGQRAHQHRRHVIAERDRLATAFQQPTMRECPHQFDLDAALQARVKMHEGAVKVRIALAEHDDVDRAREPCRRSAHSS